MTPKKGSAPFLGAAAAVVVVLLSATTPAQAPPTLEDVLQRMRAYLAEYAHHLPAIVATERYEQRVGSGMRRQQRRLQSDYGLIQLPGDSAWLGFREVLMVDGRPVTDSARRLTELFTEPSSRRFEQARRIAEESARYNIGPVIRTINDPSLILELLDARNSHRMSFSKDSEAAIDGTHAWIIKYRETVRPTIISTRDKKDQPAQGRAWIDPVTGKILRGQVSVEPGMGVTGTVDVTFALDSSVGFPVPSKMTERYTNRNFVTMSSGEATYSNYRKFTVDVEENIPLK